jgi:hypothetical protein
MARKVNLRGFSKLARGEVRVVVDRVAGLVMFRVKRKHMAYTLPLDVWIGMGFDQAVKVAAFAAKQERKLRKETL